MLLPNYLLQLLLALLLSVTSVYCFAQSPQTPVVTKYAQKFKPPDVKTYLGSFTGNGTVITVEQGKNIIGLSLKIEDAQHNEYAIASYEFLYKRVGVTEDEATGKLSPETDKVADKFLATPLTDIWVNTIKETLQKNEEFYFFDIIVKDKQNRLFFAPELRLILQ